MIGTVLKVLGLAVTLLYTIIPIFTISISNTQGNPAPEYALGFFIVIVSEYKLGLLIAMVCVPPLMYFGYKLRGELDEQETKGQKGIYDNQGA